MSVHFEGDTLYVTVQPPAPNVVLVEPFIPRVTVAPGGLQGGTGPMGPAAPIVFGRRGEVQLYDGGLKYRFAFNATLIGYSAAMGEGTPPVGSSLISQIKLNGVVLATVTIPDGADDFPEVPISVPVVAGDYLTVAVTQLGSTDPGHDLSIFIRYET